MSRKKKAPPPHPIAKAIEDVLAAGHTPRIQVDARRADVTVPDHVRERWQARLVIDLDPSWPLALEHGPDALEVTLAFQGLESRCRFGWGSIYVVLDRATGRGLVVESQLPPHELEPTLAYERQDIGRPERAEGRPALVPVDTKAAPPERRSRRKAAPSAPRKDPSPEPAARTSDDEAKERRARFRVIPGGG
jgi:stringent starvation protein B